LPEGCLRQLNIEVLNKDARPCVEEDDAFGVGTTGRRLLSVTMAIERPSAGITETVKTLKRLTGAVAGKSGSDR
jgi:hypothetical protein